MITSANATIVGQRTMHQRDDYISDITYSTSNPCSIYSANTNALAIVKFKTPKFIGSSISVDIKLPCQFNWLGAGGYDDSLCYFSVALCENDDNYHLYFESTISDPYQIAATTVKGFIGNEVTCSFSMETSCLKSEHEYYLIVWDEDWQQTTGFSIDNIDNCSSDIYHVNINYIDNITYIQESSEFKAYRCYIDNGSTLKLYVPYIDNGTSWEPL